MDTRVAVLHQQRLFREGLELLLGAAEGIEVCGTAMTSQEGIRLCIEQVPDVLLLEADGSGYDVARLSVVLRRAHRELRLIGLAAGPRTSREIAEAKRSGMCALVARSAGFTGILSAIRTAAAKPHGSNLALFRASASVETPARALLTDRELHVLHLVGAGCTSREISARLGISHKTVENHKQRAFGKLGVQNQAHAVSVAVRAGFLRSDQVLELAVAD